jgi:hypothetical protein
MCPFDAICPDPRSFGGSQQPHQGILLEAVVGDDSTMPDLGIHDTFTGPEVTIQALMLEQFCAVVGNAGESLKTAHSESVSRATPIDFAIVTGWQVRICSCLIDHFSFSM